MKITKLILLFCLMATPVRAESLFFDDEPVQGGINVVDASKTFSEIYQKLDDVKWAGKSLNIAIESLEKLNKDAHVAATDERVVLVWGDTIVGNYPRPAAGDWDAFGEITTALVLKMRERDAGLRALGQSEMYQTVVAALLNGVDENGRYIYSRAAEMNEDGRLLTSVGVEGARDRRGNFRVKGVFKDSPADAAGICTGDLISEINGAPVRAMDASDLSAVMSGFNSGTSKMTLLTPTGTKNVVLRRATIVMADADVVHRKDLSGDNEILEIIIHKISDGAVAIVAEALAAHPELSGVVLDLRASNGDDERAAAKLAGLFMGAKPVMRIVETAADEMEVVPAGNAVTDAQVVVLMSDQTRGTAEAVAAAFYENARGVLVGTPTAGAARIATRIDLNGGGALELLNKSIKTGTGRVLDGRGVFPIVCLSNIRSDAQRDAFFLNVINNDFNAVDFNNQPDVDAATIRRGCGVIKSGTDEDALAAAVSAKILTDKKVYNKLIME